MTLAYDTGSHERSNVLSRVDVGMRGRTYFVWDDSSVITLKQMWGDGYSAAQIAAALGNGLTRNAIIGRLHRSGLTAKNSPRFSDEAIARLRERKKERKRTYNNERRRELRELRVAAGRTEFGSRLPPEDVSQYEHQDDPSIGVSLLDLDMQKQCRFIRGDSRDSKPYCGQPKHPASRYYCGYHHRIIYRPRA